MRPPVRISRSGRCGRRGTGRAGRRPWEAPTASAVCPNTWSNSPSVTGDQAVAGAAPARVMTASVRRKCESGLDHVIGALAPVDLADEVGDEEGQRIGQQAHAGFEGVVEARQGPREELAEGQVAGDQARDKQGREHEVQAEGEFPVLGIGQGLGGGQFEVAFGVWRQICSATQRKVRTSRPSFGQAVGRAAGGRSGGRPARPVPRASSRRKR